MIIAMEKMEKKPFVIPQSSTDNHHFDPSIFSADGHFCRCTRTHLHPCPRQCCNQARGWIDGYLVFSRQVPDIQSLQASRYHQSHEQTCRHVEMIDQSPCPLQRSAPNDERDGRCRNWIFLWFPFDGCDLLRTLTIPSRNPTWQLPRTSPPHPIRDI